MDNQDKLLTAIRYRVNKSASVIDEVAAVLNISYDAAHRRVSCKSRFSIEETVTLCRHYAISMDSLFSGNNNVLVQKTGEIRCMEDMENYFRQSAESISHFIDTGTVMYYSAKDIPLFHTVGGTLLSKFKLYVWLNLLAGIQNQDTFEKFTISSPLLEYSTKLKDVYAKAEVNEIWNDTTINSTLQQVYYFFQAGLLSLQNAVLLLTDIKNILIQAEERCCTANSRFNLYYNELLILNNNVLLSAPHKQSLFVPYTMLGYFITDDKDTCENAGTFFKHQLKNSKSLTASGTRDRKIFFNRANQKVEFYNNKINNEMALDI